MSLQDHGEHGGPSHLLASSHISLHELDMLDRDDVRVFLPQDDQVLMFQWDKLSAILNSVSQTVVLLFDDHLFQFAKQIHILEHTVILAPVAGVTH